VIMDNLVKQPRARQLVRREARLRGQQFEILWSRARNEGLHLPEGKLTLDGNRYFLLGKPCPCTRNVNGTPAIDCTGCRARGVIVL